MHSLNFSNGLSTFPILLNPREIELFLFHIFSFSKVLHIKQIRVKISWVGQEVVVVTKVIHPNPPVPKVPKIKHSIIHGVWYETHIAMNLFCVTTTPIQRNL
jgi:hypothetical protein